jgi:hypothetical protein
MALTISDRLDRHKQQKARLAEQEAKLKNDERKVRTRRLIETGGLVEKAGLHELDSSTLYGALLTLRDGASDKGQCEKWAMLGGRTFDREAKAKLRDTTPFVLTFPAPLPREATNPLRAAGFRFNKIFRRWEGLSTPNTANELATQFGGTASAIDPHAATAVSESV